MFIYIFIVFYFSHNAIHPIPKIIRQFDAAIVIGTLSAEEKKICHWMNRTDFNGDIQHKLANWKVETEKVPLGTKQPINLTECTTAHCIATQCLSMSRLNLMEKGFWSFSLNIKYLRFVCVFLLIHTKFECTSFQSFHINCPLEIVYVGFISIFIILYFGTNLNLSWYLQSTWIHKCVLRSNYEKWWHLMPFHLHFIVDFPVLYA